jgi:hypothetical protein
VLSIGEIGYDTTNRIIKIGDGTSNWGTLKSISVPAYSTANNSNLLGVLNGNLSWIDSSTIASGGGSSSIEASATAPTSASPGDLWWNDTNGALFLRYEDVDSSQWIGINKDFARIASGEFPPTNVEDGNLWWNSYNGRLYIYHNDGDSGQWIDINNPPTLTRNISLPTTGWTGTGPFVRTVGISGVTSKDSPIIDLNTKSLTYANIEAAQEFWSKIYLADTGNNQITFYATEAPGITFILPLIVKVVK